MTQQAEAANANGVAFGKRLDFFAVSIASASNIVEVLVAITPTNLEAVNHFHITDLQTPRHHRQCINACSLMAMAQTRQSQSSSTPLVNTLRHGGSFPVNVIPSQIPFQGSGVLNARWNGEPNVIYTCIYFERWTQRLPNVIYSMPTPQYVDNTFSVLFLFQRMNYILTVTLPYTKCRLRTRPELWRTLTKSPFRIVRGMQGWQFLSRS